MYHPLLLLLSWSKHLYFPEPGMSVLSSTHHYLVNLTSTPYASISLEFHRITHMESFLSFPPTKNFSLPLLWCSDWITAPLYSVIFLTTYRTNFKDPTKVPLVLSCVGDKQTVRQSSPSCFTGTIDYKTTTLCYLCLHGLAPPYLSELMMPYYLPSRSFPSARVPSSLCQASDERNSTDGPCPSKKPLFEVLCPFLSLSFKSCLKSHLFKKYLT